MLGVIALKFEIAGVANVFLVNRMKKECWNIHDNHKIIHIMKDNYKKYTRAKNCRTLFVWEE